MSDSLNYRNYCDYYQQTLEACRAANVAFVLEPIHSERDLELALSNLPEEERMDWLTKFNDGFESSAAKQKAALIAALTSSSSNQHRAA